MRKIQNLVVEHQKCLNDAVKLSLKLSVFSTALSLVALWLALR
jgi:hypothetical protein|nr:MAG TPA: hypothetical protein [Caudoviricetes sp.]